MVYTNSTPQANQQISATQSPILQNFEFLQTGIGTEHNFDAGGSGSDMYHLQASMPNISGPETLPTDTNGMYYVKDGDSWFLANDGTKCQLTLGSATSNGYQWIGRSLLQWGVLTSVVTGSSANDYTINFPIPFPTSVFSIQTSIGWGSTPGGTASVGVRLINSGAGGKISFKIYVIGSSNLTSVNWMAVGI